MIDYVFSRIYSFYDRNRDSTPIFMACGVLSIAVFFTLLSTITIVSVIIGHQIVIDKLIYLIILLLAIIVFCIKYSNKKKVLVILEKYTNEPIKQKRRNGKVIFFYIIIVIFIPIVYGILKHNYNVDI